MLYISVNEQRFKATTVYVKRINMRVLKDKLTITE